MAAGDRAGTPSAAVPAASSTAAPMVIETVVVTSGPVAQARLMPRPSSAAPAALWDRVARKP